MKIAVPSPPAPSRGSHPETPHSALRAPHSKGVALIITLILLSVITFMAIAFLVLTRGQKSSVSTQTDQTLARLAADAGVEMAETELLAPIMAGNNPWNYDILVSTNYVNPLGFTPLGSGGQFAYVDPTNVNYAYLNGLPLTGNDALRNLANLMYNPRPPVFYTNRFYGTNNAWDFRFYLDLNRNGWFEPTGWFLPTDYLGRSFGSNYYYFTGDPQWIGGLEFPDRPHSPNNKFVYRYSYIVLPASKTLDINYIHNMAANPAKPQVDSAVGTDYFRNQGVGTWEINLASFLYDLNTNTYAWGRMWADGPYVYQPNNLYGPNPSFSAKIEGDSFVDAYSLITNRYASVNYPQALSSVRTAFGNIGQNAFASDIMDGYTAGPLMTTNWAPFLDPDASPVNRTVLPWPGSDNTNHYYVLQQDLFDATKTGYGFQGHLLATGTNLSSYDRYTFYRLLSQLGTDSPSEPAGTINLNYDNMVQKNTRGITSVTNFYPWRPIDFFTNTANKLLANAGFTFNTAHIQIYPTNFYTPSVHRLLQLAANIYDATTNRTFGVASNGFPTVFRPVFETINTNGVQQVFITGFDEVTNAYTQVLRVTRLHDLSTTNDLPVNPYDMVYGVPVIIGAKKGYPNFNKFESVISVEVTRKLEFIRKDLNGPNRYPDETNQVYIVGISNIFGIEAWNSYSNAFPANRNLQLYLTATNSAFLTNEMGQIIPLRNYNFPNPINFNYSQVWPSVGQWAGYVNPNDYNFGNTFKLPWASGRADLPDGTTNWLHLPASQYVSLGLGDDYFITLTNTTDPFQPSLPADRRFHVPAWMLNVRTRIQFALVDTSVTPARIVDYVSLAAAENPVDISSNLTLNLNYSPAYLANAPYVQSTAPGALWATNRYNPPNPAATTEAMPTYGIVNQIGASFDPQFDGGHADWSQVAGAAAPGTDREGAINFFRTNFSKTSPYPGTFGGALFLTNRFFAPFTPTRTVFFYTSWQANDPLVHYTIGDLLDQNLARRITVETNYHAVTIGKLRQLSTRYEPWGGGAGNPNKPNPETVADLRLKDPLVTRSDDWDFPSSRFPNVGWLGRVHRGTPWQTVYLKSPALLDYPTNTTWRKWTGDFDPQRNFGQLATSIVGITNWYTDASFMLPTNDWRILDLFSTAFNDNSTAGKMSVNQSGLAGWSAILGGVVTISNDLPDIGIQQQLIPHYAPMVIPPAGVYDPLATNSFPAIVRMVNAINAQRATNTTSGTFTKLGDILRVPELTVNSPFLNVSSVDQLNYGISDAAYERIPQQVLGLLKCESAPRFVIYSYGQALRPADKSIFTGGGPFFGLCTNYQVTAEVATRTVVRVEGAPTKPHAVIESFNVLPSDQ